jgi:Peptidase family C25
MQQRPKIKLELIIIIFFSIEASSLMAAEYSNIYYFEKPHIITLSNGRHLVDLENTRQKDDIVGTPILPMRTSKLFIPADEDVISIDIDHGPLTSVEGSYQIQYVTTPYPLSFKGPVNVDKPAAAIYETRARYPSNIEVGVKRQFLHGVQIILVDLMPVLYNPVYGQLNYYQKLEVRIRTEKRVALEQVMSFKNSHWDRNRILDTIDNTYDFLNRHPDPEKKKSMGTSSMDDMLFPAESTRQYVVITTRDMAPAFQTLTTHRASSEGGGYTTHIEYIDNIDADYDGIDLAEKMRNYIRDMHTNYGTQYVLLGGDSDGPLEDQVIPTRGVYARVGDYTDNNIPSDLYFGCLDGSWNADGDEFWGELDDGIDGGDIDWFSEVYVGRISADDYSEAMNQIEKIIAFETSNRANKTLLVGEELEDSTWGGDRMDWIHSFMGATPKTELYDRDWSNNSWPISQLLTYVNSNTYYWINHIGHSTVAHSMGLNNDDVFSMTNNNFLFIYAQGCYTGSIDSLNSDGVYESADSFGEAITNDYSDRGAFAYIGNSRYSWYTRGAYVEGGSNRAHKEFVEAVFSEGITQLGKANQISKTDLPLGSGMYRWIAFETNLLGDPASELDAPYALDSDCNDCEANDEPPDNGDTGGSGSGCFIKLLNGNSERIPRSD